MSLKIEVNQQVGNFATIEDVSINQISKNLYSMMITCDTRYIEITYGSDGESSSIFITGVEDEMIGSEIKICGESDVDYYLHREKNQLYYILIIGQETKVEAFMDMKVVYETGDNNGN